MRFRNVCTLLLLASPPLLRAQVPRYTIQDLGTLGGSYSRAFSINNAGGVAGESSTASGEVHPFSHAGNMSDLKPLGFDGVTGINESGEISGWVNTPDSNHRHAFLFSNGAMRDLHAPGNGDALAGDINETGQVMGSNIYYEGPIKHEHAFLYSGGTYTIIPSLGGEYSYSYHGINKFGEVTGIAGTPERFGALGHAFIYSHGAVRKLGTLGGIANDDNVASWGYDINDSGEVTGEAVVGGIDWKHAFLYSRGSMTDLRTLPGDDISAGYRLNNAGQVLGTSRSSTAGASRPFLYSDGVMYEFSQLVVNLSTGGWTTELYPADINDGGQIVGWGRTTAATGHAFLATPVDDPITFRSLKAEALQSTTGSPDDPLLPKTSSPLLRNQPRVTEGLVADGVTPLLIQMQPLDSPGNSSEYRLRVVSVTGSHSVAEIEGKLFLLQGNAFEPFGAGHDTVTLSSTGGLPAAFGFLAALEPGFLVPSDPPELMVALGLQKADGTGAEEKANFKIRKPPVALVHGYNTAGEWGAYFKSVLMQDRPDFIETVHYGVDILPSGKPDYTKNTTWTLPRAAAALSEVLKEQIEDPKGPLKKKWAFTRYDAVGHSQGGVLLRMLSSRQQNAGIPPFRNVNNFGRGRFRRVVTIGSPHNGSRMARYLGDLAGMPGIFAAIPTLLSPGNPFGSLLGVAGTLQDKFDPWGAQNRDLNQPFGPWTPDPAAKFFMIRTTIGGGAPPGLFTPVLAYELVGLGIQGGMAVLPQGADGVMDLESQGYPGGAANVYTVPSFYDISHSNSPRLFGTDAYQINCYDVTLKVREALRDEVTFSAFVVPPLLDNEERLEVDLAAALNVVIGSLIYENFFMGLGEGFPGQGQGQETEFNFRIWPEGQPLGNIRWSAEVFGPDGVTNGGVGVFETDDPWGVTVRVNSSVIGDVVLYARYEISNGGTVFAAPVKVVSIPPPGADLTAVELEPDGVSLPGGSNVILHAWAKYSDGSRLLVYPDADETSFASVFHTTAEVSQEGVMTLKAPGAAAVDVFYHGRKARSHFTVTPGSAPVIAVPSALTAVQSVPFQYPVSATNLPGDYGATGLPPGLSIDGKTGVISGTPSEAGTFTVRVDAANSAGIGRGTFTLSVTPAAVGLANWRLMHFGSVDNSGDGADLNDFDGDGIPNLAEFAFGLDPARSSIGELPVGQIVGNELTIIFSEPAGITGINYGAEWSASLRPEDWTSIPDTGVAPNHLFKVPVGPNAKVFMRLTAKDQ